MLSETQKHKLKNGLTVLLKPDHRLPVACVLTWVEVGYFNEPDHLTGISHFIEHLFFKGTPSRGVGVIAGQTKSIGGYLNASTIYDQTYYYTVVPSHNLVQAIDIQSDALLHPLFDAEEMEKEKEVIIQELKRKYDNPDPFTWEKLVAMSFEKHRIRRWRMGTEADIRRYTRDDVIQYYERYYRPENITFIVVGDFDPQKILPEIERRYGDMPAGKVDREISPREGTQTAPRMDRMLGDIAQPIIKMGFHGPDVSSADYHASIFFSILMGRGRSSRFYRTLKEEKDIVDGIGTSLYSSKDVGYFTVEMETRPEHIAACEEEVWAEIDRVRRDPPTEQEVERVRNIVEANFFSEKEDVMGQAYSLAYFESLGGYQLAMDYVNRMRAVTPTDLVNVAQNYFTYSKMNLMEYVPRSVGEGAPTDQRLESLKKRLAARFERNGDISEPAEIAPAAPMAVWSEQTTPISRGMEAIVLSNGVTLLHLQVKSLPLTSVAIYFPGGRLDETEGTCGISQFMLNMSLKGTESRTADEIAFEMESLGSSVGVEANADIFGFSTSLVSRNLEKGMEILSDVVLHPTFPNREIELERSTVLSRIRRLRDDSFRYSVELFYRSLYGLHPYGLPRNGNETTVNHFDRTKLMDWYAQTFKWKKMVVAMVGDVERQRAIDLVSQHFSVSQDLDEEALAQLFPVTPARGMREIVEERDRRQTSVSMGFSGVTIKDSRYFALEVLRNILSGMGGRFFMELREKLALAYTVTAFNIGLLRSGAFFTYIATSPEKEREAKSRLADELEKVRSAVPSAKEVADSKAYTRGSHSIGLQGNMSVAYTYLQHYLAGRGLEAVAEYDQRIEDVTQEDIRKVASQIIDLDNAALGIVRGRAK